MKAYITRILLSFLLFAVLPAKAQAEDQNQFERHNIRPSVLVEIANNYRGKPYKDFDDFALDVYISGKRFLSSFQHEAIGEYAADRPVSPRQSFVAYRLLGVYTNLKYGGEARRMLAKLVSIPTVNRDKVRSRSNREFIRFEKVLKSYAAEFDLKYKNIKLASGASIYELSLPASRKGTLVGLHAYADVPPAGDKWQFADNSLVEPFKLTYKNSRFYGRGVRHNKAAIVAAMIAMRVIKEEKISLLNRVRLLVSTESRNSFRVYNEYQERRRVPSYNIGLMGEYPVAAKASLVNRFWLQNLLNIASENMPRYPDYRKLSKSAPLAALPNYAQFGLADPSNNEHLDKPYEYQTIDQFLLNLQVVTEIIMRVGLIENFD